MPDHLHLVLFVKERLPKALGYYMASLKGACSRAVWTAMPELGLSRNRSPLFERGYNDRILFRDIQLDSFLHYVDDNPRRLLVRRLNRDYFQRVNNFALNGKQLSAYGNLFLLNDPQKVAVKVSRKYSPEELRQRKLSWLRTIENGGVIVSPFISPAEKKVRDWAMANGGKIIQIMTNGFPERYKPTETFFNYCAKGKLLQIAPAHYQTSKLELTYKLAASLNSIAASIASSPPIIL
jgi:hypothetical protein